MRVIFIAIFCALFINSLPAQDLQRIDSLIKLVPNRNGTERFNILNDIAWAYRFVNQDSTISYAQRAYALGKELGLRKKLATPLNFIGVAHEYKGEAIDAYEYYKQALTMASSQGDDLEIAYAKNNTGRLFFDQGNIARSLECYTTALRIFKLRNDSTGIAYVYLSLARLYQAKKNLKKAEDHFLKVYQIRLKLARKPNVSSLLQLGLFYRESGNLKKSNKYFEKADSLCNVRNDEVAGAEVNILLAENRFKEGKLNEADILAKKGFRKLQKNNLSRDLPSAYHIMGKIYFGMNDLAKSKENFRKVVALTKPFNNVELKMDAHYYLGQIYSKEGLAEQELRSKNQYLMLKDFIKAKDLAKQIDRLKFQFQLEIEQRKRENELLKAVEISHSTIIKKQQIINVVYAIVIVVIVVIAVLLFYSVTMKQRHNAELAKKQEEIVMQSEALKASNTEIEKINTNLEALVNDRTRKIKNQNQRLTEYAYFNAHQIRGPLARILGLISVLNLEFNRDAFGPYINMLNQAGTDLDQAIRQVNDLLDNIEEE